jgi:hypothetical protein
MLPNIGLSFERIRNCTSPIHPGAKVAVGALVRPLSTVPRLASQPHQ